MTLFTLRSSHAIVCKAVDGVGDIVGGRRMVTYDRSISMEELYVSQCLFEIYIDHYILYSLY